MRAVSDNIQHYKMDMIVYPRCSSGCCAMQKSSELLSEAKAVILSHEEALEAMRSKLAELDSSKLQSAAADTLKIAAQVCEPTIPHASNACRPYFETFFIICSVLVIDPGSTEAEAITFRC